MSSIAALIFGSVYYVLYINVDITGSAFVREAIIKVMLDFWSCILDYLTLFLNITLNPHL